MDEMRADFEAHYGVRHSYERVQSGKYKYTITERDWQDWQAAWTLATARERRRSAALVEALADSYASMGLGVVTSDLYSCLAALRAEDKHE